MESIVYPLEYGSALGYAVYDKCVSMCIYIYSFKLYIVLNYIYYFKLYKCMSLHAL